MQNNFRTKKTWNFKRDRQDADEMTTGGAPANRRVGPMQPSYVSAYVGGTPQVNGLE
jgi:hypothetical protein